jgi:hypothetical protein
MSLLLLALIETAAAGCPADAETLRADVMAAIAAHDAQDWAGFEKQVATVHEDVGCLTGLADVATATELHRMAALYFAHHGDEDNTRDAMRGALSLDGAFAPTPERVAVQPILESAHAAAIDKGPGKDQDLPEGSWVIDGRPDKDHLPLERATLVQRHAQQADVHSWYVFGGQIPPELLPRSEADEPATAGGGLQSRPLLYSGLAGLALAAGGLSLAELSWKSTMDQQLSEDEAHSRYRTAHGVSMGSTALGVVGGGLVVGAVINGRW